MPDSAEFIDEIALSLATELANNKQSGTPAQVASRFFEPGGEFDSRYVEDWGSYVPGADDYGYR